MLLKKEFAMMCYNLGLEDHELDLAELIWSKCEKAMFGVQEKQVPRILSAPNKNLKPKVKVNNEEALTQGEIQKLIKMLTVVLNYAEPKISEAKAIKAHYYDICDPENPETKEAYDSFNDVKKYLNKLKQYKSDMSIVQRKLKKLRKNAKA